MAKLLTVASALYLGLVVYLVLTGVGPGAWVRDLQFELVGLSSRMVSAVLLLVPGIAARTGVEVLLDVEAAPVRALVGPTLFVYGPSLLAFGFCLYLASISYAHAFAPERGARTVAEVAAAEAAPFYARVSGYPGPRVVLDDGAAHVVPLFETEAETEGGTEGGVVRVVVRGSAGAVRAALRPSPEGLVEVYGYVDHFLEGDDFAWTQDSLPRYALAPDVWTVRPGIVRGRARTATAAMPVLGLALAVGLGWWRRRHADAD